MFLERPQTFFYALLFVFFFANDSVKTVHAQQNPLRVVEFSFTPTRKAQIALWIEKADGTFLKTISLTEAVAYRGIGNRPGATQMNSGYRWPYGRREGVLPVWGRRRLTQENVEPFKRVIFQNRRSEGNASRNVSDHSPDDYYCLSFTKANTRDEALDAVSCASMFTSDKGRYIKQEDVENGYSEPWEDENGAASSRLLSLTSLYPPRRDVEQCTDGGCYDHRDVSRYNQDARSAMPTLDAVTSATPPGDQEKTVLLVVPSEWEDGEYVAWLEINVEGDYNDTYNPENFGTPQMTSEWDRWASSYGYPYRGQPSVVFTLPFVIGSDPNEFESNEAFTTVNPTYYGTLHGEITEDPAPWPNPIDETITDDPIQSPGSGADRLRKDAQGNRLRATSRFCNGDERAPQPISSLEAFPHPDRKLSHQWAMMQFEVPESQIELQHLDVRFSVDPITSSEDFEKATRARKRDLSGDESTELTIPVGQSEGSSLEVEFGELRPETKYFVAIRAQNACGQNSELSSDSFITDPIQYTTVAPCFVATAAFGSPMAHEIHALRRFRDQYLLRTALGREFVRFYYTVGPSGAEWLEEHDWAKPMARFVLKPFVEMASWLTEDDQI